MPRRKRMTGVAKALADQMGIAWRLARARVTGLTDDEFFWEPVVPCWSLRRKSEMVAGVLHHSGEVGRLRDLYRNRHRLTAR